MKKNHTRNFLLILFLIGLFVGCQSNTEPTASPPADKSEEKAQAILLTQTGEFDPNDKTKISGDYVARQRLIVPQNLEPQNKWVMFEGPVLENDLIAYRFYMDSRHRNDIYGKRVKDLVMDTVGWQYHDIMDWGSDILKVNQSLGIGSPAIWYQDSLYALSEYDKKIVEVTSPNAETASVRTTLTGLKVGDQKFDLIQDWSLRAGEPWSTIRLEVVDGQLPEGMYFATGIVKHLEDLTAERENNFLYAFTWGEQSYHNENMGMGLVMNLDDQPEKVPNIWSHTYVFKNPRSEMSYQFLAAWEKDVIGVKDAGAFENLIQQACKPLQ